MSPTDLTVSVGQQVKLCHGSNYGICSALVTVIGPPQTVTLTPPTGGGSMTITGPVSSQPPAAGPGNCNVTVPGGSTPTVTVNPPGTDVVQQITVGVTPVGAGPSTVLPPVNGPITVTATCGPAASADLTAVNTFPGSESNAQ